MNRPPSFKGKKHSEASKMKMSDSLKGKNLGNTHGFKKGKPAWNKGKKSSVPAWNKGKKLPFKVWNKGKKLSYMTGENHPMWIKDRSLVVVDVNNERGSPRHKQWSKSVKNRDGWKCRISNQECSGKLVAHHILAWKTHPELRYEVKNGITLCHFHHPRKRNDEMRLSPYFQQLVTTRAQ